MTLDSLNSSIPFTSWNISTWEANGMQKIGFARRPADVAALKAAGAETVFEELDDLLHGVRKLDAVLVIDLRAFGTSQREIAAVIAKIRAKGAAVMEAATGRHAGDYGAEWMAETGRLLANDRRGGPDAASEIGKRGQVASLKSRRKGQRPWTQCQPIWHDKALTTVEAVAKINAGFKPRSQAAIYNKLGARGVLPGRRS